MSWRKEGLVKRSGKEDEKSKKIKHDGKQERELTHLAVGQPHRRAHG